MPKEILTVEEIDAYQPEIGRVLWGVQDARRRTLAALENADDALVNWRSREEEHNVGSLLYHLAAIELSWLFEEILE